MRQLTLFDASGFMFRAFHALPALTAPDGTAIGALMGFCTMIMKWYEEHKPSYWAMVFDGGRSLTRTQLYPDYKAQRPAPDPQLVTQFLLAKELCKVWNIPILQQNGIEADDLIASAASRAEAAGWKVIIVSSDKDMSQLVNEQITIYDPVKNRLRDVYAVTQEWGVNINQIPDVQALAGDASDNIPGIPGIGPKTATQWIQRFHSLEGVLDHIAELGSMKKQELVREYAQQARLCLRLVTLDKTLPLDHPESWSYQHPDSEKLQRFLEGYGLGRLWQKFVQKGWVSGLYQKPAVSIRLYPLPSIQEIRSKGIISLVHQQEQWYGCYEHSSSYYAGPLSKENIEQLFSYEDCLKILYDAKHCIHQGYVPKSFDDVMVMHYVLNGVAHHRHWDDFVTHMRSELSMEITNAEEQALGLWQMWSQLKTSLRSERLLYIYEGLDRPLICVLARMEEEGIGINISVLETLRQQWSEVITELESQIHQEVGETFTIGSPKQLGCILFEKLGWPGGKKSKTGAYKTDSSVLESYAHKGYHLADLLLQWRHISKLQNTYTAPLIQHTDPKTQRLKTTYSMVSTSTGRLSSLNPNLQNIPLRTQEGRKIRTAFQAKPGYVFLCCDYSQIELRLLASMGNIELLQQAFAQGHDIHRQMASTLFSLPLEHVTPEQRRSAKTINFGILYGMSSFGLSQQLQIPLDQAQHLINTYFQQYPGIQAYMDRCIQQAKEKGYVTTLWGRRCFIPNIHSGNYLMRTAAERQAINAPLQGTSADIIKQAMIHIDSYLRTTNAQAQILLQIHDELVLEISETAVTLLQENLIPLMENAAPEMSLKVDSRIERSWS